MLPFHSDQRKSARLAFISRKVFPIPAVSCDGGDPGDY